MNNAVEAVGFALLLGFLYLIWPPLALAGGGLLLVLWANVRTSAPGRIGTALGAARRAWKAAAATDNEGQADADAPGTGERG